MPSQSGPNPAVSPSVYLLKGTHAQRPAAGSDNIDYYYWETDTAGGILFRSTGLVWKQLLAGISTDGANGTAIDGYLILNSLAADAANEASVLNGSYTIQDAIGSQLNKSDTLQVYQAQQLTDDNGSHVAVFARLADLNGHDYFRPAVVIDDETASTADFFATRAVVGGNPSNVHTFGKSGGLGVFTHAAPAVQPTGGAATAGGTYSATEQGMIQKAYDALRGMGILS